MAQIASPISESHADEDVSTASESSMPALIEFSEPAGSSRSLPGEDTDAVLRLGKSRVDSTSPNADLPMFSTVEANESVLEPFDPFYQPRLRPRSHTTHGSDIRDPTDALNVFKLPYVEPTHLTAISDVSSLSGVDMESVVDYPSRVHSAMDPEEQQQQPSLHRRHSW